MGKNVPHSAIYNKVGKRFFLSLLLLLCISYAGANNIKVVSPQIVNHQSSGTASVRFDLYWDHSWKENIRNNWDAAWVFVKCYHKDLAQWNHVYLDTLPASHAITTSNVPFTMDFPIEELGGFRRTPGLFIYRSQGGNGGNEIKGITLKFNYLDHGFAPTDTLIVSVFAIEMVYIPSQKFVIGDGISIKTLKKVGNVLSVGTGQKKEQLETIEAENALFFGLEPIPDLYPKGFGSFYTMKYEISQHAYVDFLNTLTQDQQKGRTSVPPTAAIGSFALPAAPYTSNPAQYRNYIKIRNSAVADAAALYGHSIDNVSWVMEDNGGNIGCNFLTWRDGLAYLDWACLRPMTELEFEKACRGHKKVIQGEYAWAYKAGYPVAPTNSFVDAGLSTERSKDSFANYLESGKAPWVIRVGAFAKDSSTRYEAGCSYYGVMNMSDNLWDRCINVSTPEGRKFSAKNGDGEINPASGDANVLGWPISKGGGFRGYQVSSREYADYVNDTKHPSYGFRGVRTKK